MDEAAARLVGTCSRQSRSVSIHRFYQGQLGLVLHRDVVGTAWKKVKS